MGMLILISNADGIYSPGIAALAIAAAHSGEVRIVAPDVEESSMGHAITHSRSPLRYRRTPIAGFQPYQGNETPADCVALSAHHWERVDLGLNLGNSCWHSGTLAAAKQAALLGLRGIAFSMPVGDAEPDFAALKPWLEHVIRLLLKKKTLTLVNFPHKPRGIRWSPQSVRHYDGKSSLPKTRRSVRFSGSPSCRCTKRKKAQIPGLSCTITVS